ncbi:uncharacterized protein LOC136074071 [Hydra vulgaris]|uniref:Uncharacterized protein LOC136074071 n=1 Tax=Hydra vulgaris TaxID=6087 RepID=A0ABM4B0X8_HYDVU
MINPLQICCSPFPAIFLLAIILSFFSKCFATLNQADLQKEIFAKCIEFQPRCKCDGDFFKRENKFWSKLNISCESFETFHEMFKITKFVYEGSPNEDMEFYFPNSYIPSQKKITEVQSSDPLPPEIQENCDKVKKVFEIIEVNIKVNSELLEVDVSSEFDYLKYITKLTIEGGKCFNKVKPNSFLQVFTNIYTLNILSDARLINIYLPALSNLYNFQLNISNAVNFFCAFQNEPCLVNPKGFKSFSVLFKNSMKLENDFNIYGKFRLPRFIENLSITFSSVDITYHDSECSPESRNNIIETQQTKPIFENIQFEKVLFEFPEIKDRANISANLISKLIDGIDIIKTQIYVRGNEDNVNSLLSNIYQQGLQGKLVIHLLSYFKRNILYIYLNQSNLDESQFEMCAYGKKLLRHAHQQIYKQSNGDILIIRAFHLNLSQVVNIANVATTSNTNIKFIRVYTYNFEVDQCPYKALKLFIEQQKIKLEFFYVNIGTAKTYKIEAETDKFIKTDDDTFYPIPPDDTISLKDFNYAGDFFKVQFISMKSFEMADPIFTRAITTCLVMNIGLYHKTSPSALLSDNKQLSTWYNVIQNSLEFNESLYDSLEVSRTQTAFKHLKDFIMLSDNMNAQITRVPSLSLQVLSENIQILSQAGRDIRDKSKHFETSLNFKNMGKGSDFKSEEIMQAIADSKIAILEASKQKSVSLGEIELRKQHDIEKQWNQSNELITFLTKEFEKFQKEVEVETVKFKRGVILATGLAVAEAAAEAVNCILGIFSGGFNPAKALNTARKVTKLATIIPKIINALKKIADLIFKRKLLATTFKKVKESWKIMSPKLTDFFNRQKMLLRDAWYNVKTVYDEKTTKQLIEVKKFFETSGAIVKSTQDIVSNTVNSIKAARTVWVGYDVDDPTPTTTSNKVFNLTQNISTIEEALKLFRNDEENAARNQGETMNLIDVFQWRIAKEQVTGMIDTTLSDDVPEATGYRTALLKMLTTGEAKTQAILNQALLETSFSASVEARKLYINESISAGKEILKTEEGLKKREETSDRTSLDEIETKHSLLDLDIEWEKFAIKLELVRSNEEYCNAYYYFHLEKCQDDLRIRPSDDLEKILSIQNMLLYQSNVKLQDLFPPPQTFTDLTLTFKKEKYCDCFISSNNETTNDTIIMENISELKDKRERELNSSYKQIKACLEGINVKIDGGEQTEIHKKINNMLTSCKSSPIESVKESKQFIYNVDIDSSYFEGHERVRIDEVKVIFKGAKTKGGVIKVYAESSGISEDRYKDHCFKFIGDRWIRLLSYYSENVSASKKAVADKNKQSSKRGKKLNKLISEKLDTLETLLQKQGKKEMEQVTIIEAGNIHKNFEGLFTSPTVFTTWLFILPEKLNPGLNLTNLIEIELKFSGSFIASDYTKKTIQCNINEENNNVTTTTLQQFKSKSKRITSKSRRITSKSKGITSKSKRITSKSKGNASKSKKIMSKDKGITSKSKRIKKRF